MKNTFFINLFFVFVIAAVLFACKVPQYASSSDIANTMIVNEAKNLIGKSTDNYSIHAMEVEVLKARIDSIVVEENKRKLNQATNAMWTVVQKDRFSLYGFFDLWKQQNTVSPAAVAEMNQKLLSILNVIQTWEQRKKGGPLYTKQ
jgi:ATP-dependent protease ClpP protease subunit